MARARPKVRGVAVRVAQGHKNEVLLAAVLVRPLRSREVLLLRDLRLRALRDSPESFGESAASARARPLSEWERLVATVTPPSSQAAYVAEIDDRAVGIVYALLDPDDPDAGRLGGLWVDPTVRRRGVATALVSAVRAWGEGLTKRRLLLWVPEHATAARRVYDRAGFVTTGRRSEFSGVGSVIEMRLAL